MNKFRSERSSFKNWHYILQSLSGIRPDAGYHKMAGYPVPTRTSLFSIIVFPCRHHGPEGFPVRGPHHEEVAPPQADPALRCLHPGGAHLHHYGAHEIRQPARVPPR